MTGDKSAALSKKSFLNTFYKQKANFYEVEAPDFFLALLLGLAAGSEKQSVHFALRDTVMPSHSLIASNLLLVNPLLYRWKADPHLQSRIAKLQQALNSPFGFAVLLHRDAIVTTTKFPVDSVASA